MTGPYVRQSIALTARVTRRPEERLSLPFRSTLAFLARLSWRLPITSRFGSWWSDVPGSEWRGLPLSVKGASGR
jgi:hypothetical protein